MSNCRSLLLACMPKSGSTFTCNVLSALPRVRVAELVSGYGSREQELEHHLVRRESSLIGLVERVGASAANSDWRGAFRAVGRRISEPYFVAQHHTRNSGTTRALCERYGIRIAVITRRLPDAVISLDDWLSDHARRLNPWAVVPRAFYTMPATERHEWIIRHIMPWYVNFSVGWLGQFDEGPRLIHVTTKR